MPNFEALLREDGSNNDAGLVEIHFYAPKSFFRYIPEPTSHELATNNSEVVTISEDFVFHTGKFWLPVYCTLGTGELKSKQVGERDGKSYENTADLFFPGSKKEGAGFFEVMKNTNILMLIRERDGAVRVLGSARFSAEIKENEHTTGKEITNRKGFTYQVRSEGRYAPYYEGDILTQEGIIPFGQYEVPLP